MRVLLIYCHPKPDSFSGALRDAAMAALTEAGHTIELRDLHAEGFDPVLSTHQRDVYFNETEVVRGLEDQVESLRRAEALLLVYPTWWFGMPAQLKGWFDRVWLPGVAFTLGGPLKMRPLLTGIRRIGVITTYGSPWWLLWWVGFPDRSIVRRGIKPLCARGCRVAWMGLTDMDNDSPERRRRFLARIRRRLSAWR